MMICETGNMVGGDCVSDLHMILFIISLVVIGFLCGYLVRQIQEERKNDGILE